MNDFDNEFNQERVTVKAPNWFVNAIKEFRIRNSIRITDVDFVAYLILQWEANKFWLEEDKIRDVLKLIGSNQSFIHLPDDKDWELGRVSVLKEIRDEYFNPAESNSPKIESPKNIGKLLK